MVYGSVGGQHIGNGLTELPVVLSKRLAAGRETCRSLQTRAFHADATYTDQGIGPTAAGG